MSSDPEDELNRMTLEDELTEYFIQCREDGLNKLTPKSKFNINITENVLLPLILEESREDFRKTIHRVLLRAFAKYKIEENRLDLISKIKEVFSDVKIDIKIPKTNRMNEIRAEKHEGKIITFPAEIFTVGTPKTEVLREIYECDCANTIIREAELRREICPTCHEELKSIGVAESETVQTITLKEISKLGGKTTQFVAELHREEADVMQPSEKKMFTAIFRSIPPNTKRNKSKTKYEIVLYVINTHPIDKIKTAKPDPLTLQTYKDMAKKGVLIDKLVDAYAPHIYGNREAKLSCLLSIIGGVEKGDYRGRIHIFLVGDPATGKTQIMKYMTRITSNSGITDGTGATGVGLGAGMVKLPTGEMGLAPGPCVKYDLGNLGIDELDKMDKEEYEMLLGIMEDGLCRRTVAGVDAELNARVSLIACANPKGGKWDRKLQGIADNVNLSPQTMSRFDLMIRFLNIANEEEDSKILDHIMKSRGGRDKGLLTDDELTSYCNYVRELEPSISLETERTLRDFYVKRERYQTDEESLSMDQRQYGALVRISHAFAKMLFKPMVDEECVNLAIDLYKKCIASFGISLEEGGSISEGSKGLRKYIENKDQSFRRIFRKLEEDAGAVFREELVEEMIKERRHWKSEEHAHSYINISHARSSIIEKSNGELKLVD